MSRSELVLGKLRTEVSSLTGELNRNHDAAMATTTAARDAADESTFKRRPAMRTNDRTSQQPNAMATRSPTSRRRRFSSLRDHDLNQSEFDFNFVSSELDASEFHAKDTDNHDNNDDDGGEASASNRTAVQHDESPDLDLITLSDDEGRKSEPANNLNTTNPALTRQQVRASHATTTTSHGFDDNFMSLNLNLTESNTAPATTTTTTSASSTSVRAADENQSNNSLSSDFVHVSRPNKTKTQQSQAVNIKDDDPFAFATDILKKEKEKGRKAGAKKSPMRSNPKPVESSASPRVTRRLAKSNDAQDSSKPAGNTRKSKTAESSNLD